jgi:tetratricopeptide (TPR) repeat protein
MYYSLGADDQASLKEGVKCFAAILDSAAAAADIRELARYRLGKCYERLGDVEAALREYMDVHYQYDLDRHAGRVRDWFYFARTGYDAARLLVQKERYRQAVRIYERLAKSGIPTAGDAQQKATELRTAHNLSD